VFDSVSVSEQSIWLVIALFYVLDNVKQLPGNQLIFHETWKLNWRAAVPSDTLVFLNKQIFLLNILLPHTLTIPLEWLTAEPYNASRIRRADRLLRVARRKIFSFRCISVISFFAFFVEGPILTHWRGLTFALLHIAPIYAGALIMLLFSFLSDRRFWQLSATQAIAATAEAAICPAYLVNITHRVSWKYIRVNADGGAYSLLRCRSSSIEDLKSALSFALEEIEQKVAYDPRERDRLIAYRESILR
jgi:hypothetical protein